MITYKVILPKKCPNKDCLTRKNRLKLTDKERKHLARMPAITERNPSRLAIWLKKEITKRKKRKYYCKVCYDLGVIIPG